jgi:hypothetical protein
MASERMRTLGIGALLCFLAACAGPQRPKPSPDITITLNEVPATNLTPLFTVPQAYAFGDARGVFIFARGPCRIASAWDGKAIETVSVNPDTWVRIVSERETTEWIVEADSVRIYCVYQPSAPMEWTMSRGGK